MAQNRRNGPSKSIGLIRKDNRERKAKPQNKYLTERTGWQNSSGGTFSSALLQENRGRKKPVWRLCSSNAGPNSRDRNDSSFFALKTNPTITAASAASARYSSTAIAVPSAASKMPV